MLRRLPIASEGPIFVFAVTARRDRARGPRRRDLRPAGQHDRRAHHRQVALPWTLLVLFITRREPEFALNPIVPIVDFSLLVLLEVVAPDTVVAVRAAALFLVASHAHFQGERRGMAVAALGSAALVIATQIRGDEPVDGDLFAFYELVFVVAALATASSSAARCEPPSRRLGCAPRDSRRTIQAEGQVRRRVAEAIHDGPVQELIGLDMILSAAGRAADGGTTRRRRP